MKKILLLHCWFGHHDSEKWYSWTKKNLEKLGYEVNIPDIPTMDGSSPDLDIQINYLINNKLFNEDTIIIGHSLGALLAMRLSERYKIKKLILVSAWDFNDLTVEHRSYWKKPLDHNSIMTNVAEVVCLVSDNDPFITLYQAEEMGKRLNAKVIRINGFGHFTFKNYGVTQIPQLLDCVNKL